jgi:hypothetical protein
MGKSKSRDLSEDGGRQLNVTIEGVGSFGTDFLGPMPLADHVAHCVAILTGRMVPIHNRQQAPWELVSFDRKASTLTVRPVKEKK